MPSGIGHGAVACHPANRASTSRTIRHAEFGMMPPQGGGGFVVIGD